MQTLFLYASRFFLALVLIAAVIGMTGASVASAYEDDEEASCWISASPSSIYEDGSTTLSWGSSDADSGWISDIGDVPLSGSRVVYDIEENTTFTYTVENDQGTASCSTKVHVRSDTHGYSSSKAPGCNIYRENTAWGSGTVLRWSSTNASSANLSGVGSVSIYGAYTVYPTNRTTYTLTVYGNGQSRSCELTIGSGSYTYPSTPSYGNYGYTYPQYQQPYVYLSQIPYTGIDLGVVGTAVYFLALMSFAIAGGYLLSYYNGGVMRLSFAQEVKAAARNQARSLARLLGK
ncbi:MAG: hypothetical protein WAZ27_03325 [Minisyncoccia bacterium]